MTIPRVAIAAYIVVLTVGLLAGQWPLQGPRLFGTFGSHGVHAGDVVVLAISAVASLWVMGDRH